VFLLLFQDVTIQTAEAEMEMQLVAKITSHEQRNPISTRLQAVLDGRNEDPPLGILEVLVPRNSAPNRSRIAFTNLAWGQTPKGIPVSASQLPRLKVAVDPGHGGDDRGAKGQKGLKEKEVALDLAIVLKDKLQEAGFDVVLTRQEDVLIPVWDRAQIANEAGADLFISLHLNAAKARAAKGSEVYFLSLDAGDADAAEVAALENEGAGQPPGQDSVVASILDDMAQKAFLQDSEKLAVAVQNQLNHLVGIKERGVKQAPFAVLRSAAMPAVLVETAFISNPKEEAKLKDPAFRKKVAEAITQEVKRFFTQVGITPKRKALEPLSAGTPRNPKKPS
jgi:N-acetylmuramoyl-L-alanine amidase